MAPKSHRAHRGRQDLGRKILELFVNQYESKLELAEVTKNIGTMVLNNRAAFSVRNAFAQRENGKYIYRTWETLSLDILRSPHSSKPSRFPKAIGSLLLRETLINGWSPKLP